MAENDAQAPAGEFILFTSADGKVKMECRFESDTLWLSQAMLGELYGKAKATISEHIKHIFEEGELQEDAVVRFFRTTAHGCRTILSDIMGVFGKLDEYGRAADNICTTHPLQRHFVDGCLGRKNRLLGGFFISGEVFPK